MAAPAYGIILPGCPDRLDPVANALIIATRRASESLTIRSYTSTNAMVDSSAIWDRPIQSGTLHDNRRIRSERRSIVSIARNRLRISKVVEAASAGSGAPPL